MLGLSQTQLGKECGVTFQQVQKYERGSNRIGSSRLIQIANALKMDITALFDGCPGLIADVPTQDVTALLEDVAQMPLHKRQALSILLAG